MFLICKGVYVRQDQCRGIGGSSCFGASGELVVNTVARRLQVWVMWCIGLPVLAMLNLYSLYCVCVCVCVCVRDSVCCQTGD